MLSTQNQLAAMQTHAATLDALIAEAGDGRYAPLNETIWKLQSAREDLAGQMRALEEILARVAPEILEIESGYQN